MSRQIMGIAFFGLFKRIEGKLTFSEAYGYPDRVSIVILSANHLSAFVAVGITLLNISYYLQLQFFN